MPCWRRSRTDRPARSPPRPDYLHNANSWLPDGAFNRPTDVALWKSELVLSIALAAPLVRWIATALVPHWRESGGSYCAREFALYVNFSGIAVLLWTGEAGLFRSARLAGAEKRDLPESASLHGGTTPRR